MGTRNAVFDPPDVPDGTQSSELMDARVGRLQAHLIQTEDGESSEYLTLSVLGKGGKVRAVPFVPELETMLDKYLVARGLPDWHERIRRGLAGTRLLTGSREDRAEDSSLDASTVY